MMEWIETAQRMPPMGQEVMGINLSAPFNSDWEWRPFIACWDGMYWRNEESEPDMWAFIPLPPLPDCPERSAALKRAEKERDIHAKMDALKQELASLK